ncbi:MAG: DUF4364 family protein [Anaerotruncus sp.]|nr:DUF4364 family protein [Anaerotruncus sp.]
MGDIFRAGVEPGGLTMDYEIKVTICYILREIERPMPVSALMEVFVGQGIGNYFEVASAAAGLVKSGHIEIHQEEHEGECYYITDIGANAAETFEKDLPLSVRDKAVEAAIQYFINRQTSIRNSSHTEKVADGYLLTLSVKATGSNLLSITILLPDSKTCKRVQHRFMRDPITVYKGVVALLTGNYTNVDEFLGEVKGE